MVLLRTGEGNLLMRKAATLTHSAQNTSETLDWKNKARTIIKRC